MTANKLLQVLLRSEVKEISLHVGEPVRALVNNAYRRITPNPLTEDDIIGFLAAWSGREHLLGLTDGCRWKHVAEIGTVRVRAGYEGSVLKASVRLLAAPAAAPAVAVVAPVAAPTAATVPPVRSRSKRPPAPVAAAVEELPRQSAPSLAPKRASKRPPPAMPSKAPSRAPSKAPPARADRPEAADPSLRSLSEAFNFEPTGSLWANQFPAQELPAAPVEALPKFEGDALDDLFGEARERRATDLHVLANRPPMLRIAGELVQQSYVVTEEQAETLILRRVPDAARAALDRDGSCDFAMVHPAYGRFRANVNRQRTGIKLTARPIGDHIPTLAELGLPESIGRATDHHQGLIVITGPTGHGKTTTLNAIVGIINRERRHHVITVEDPIEYIHPTAKAVISQREVGTHTKSFASALKGSLREDPDVIVIGELRDTETVRIALSASETGHLVISTMNTPSAAKAIERLIDLFPPGDQPQVRLTLAGGLRLIVSQRLLPNTDRTGLCAAAEILPGNMPLWNLIRENRTYQIASLQQRGKGLGIIRLDESLAALVRSGRTTMEQAKAVAEQPEHLDALVQGKPIIQRPAEPPPGQAVVRAQAAKAAATAMAADSSKKAADLGKSMLSRAGKFFGNEG